jgi:hypothetical protein
MDGEIYSPVRGSLSSSGYAIRNVLDADVILSQINWFKNPQNRDGLTTRLAEDGVVLPPDADFCFQFFDDSGYCIVEKRTGLRIRLAH